MFRRPNAEVLFFKTTLTILKLSLVHNRVYYHNNMCRVDSCTSYRLDMCLKKRKLPGFFQIMFT